MGYLLRDNRVIQALDNIDNTGRFFCSGSGVVHVASGAGIMAPDSVTLDQHNRYHSKSHGADYIVVTHPNFSSAIDPLVNFRAAKGMRTFKADINEVYDSFSFGEFDPAAIKEFLRRAYHKWSGNPLRYVLLVGDATWDYRDYRGKGGMFVPTHFEPTVFYRTASDNWFASVAGEDELPDLRIGRLPVRTEAQTTTWVNKIVTYETNPSAVQKKVVFVSDNADSTFDFPDASDQHAKLVPSQYQTQKIYLGPLTSSEVRTQTINSFNEGVFLIQYNGHGAIQQWADERLLYSTDWSATSNTGHLPFVLVTNCLSGHFVSPWYDSIAETFTQSGDVGAIGFFASTGINTPYAQHLLATEIWQLLWKGENEVGLLLTAAKNRIGSGHGHLDVIRSYTLIGDPATKLAYPR